MKQRHRSVSTYWITVASLLFLSTSSTLATPIVFSGNSGFGIEGTSVGSQSGGLIAFDTDDLSTAHVPFDFPGNLDAVHILESGNYLVSYHSGVTIGGFTFDDDHVVEYDVNTNVVTSFFDYAGILSSAADADIDAFFLLPNGNHVFSNATSATIAGLEITENDLVEYNPSTGAASVYFSGDLIQDGDRFNNLSGASLFSDNVLALSVSTGGTPAVTVGGQAFRRNEIVLYNMESGDGSLLVGGDQIQATAVSAVHIGDATTVPEPASPGTVLFLAWIAFVRTCNKRIAH